MNLLMSLDEVLIGKWDAAETRAVEALKLCSEHGYQLLAGSGQYLMAQIAACRGEEARSAQYIEDMTRWALPRGVATAQMFAAHARALSASARGDFGEAFAQTTILSPAGELPRFSPIATQVIFELVEAAVQTGRLTEARAHVDAIRQANLRDLSSRMALLQTACEALTSEDNDVPAAYEAALALPDVSRWPFDLARVQLAYGAFLRRRQSVSASRTQLAAAAEAFARLGARPFEARALRELQATGQTRTSAGSMAIGALTPQEREIAELAASGLSNKKIAERLSVSHRTVANHLYSIFPKLGVTKRAALRDALPAASAGTNEPDEQLSATPLTSERSST